ncbi:MAG: metal-dependent hydrolase [Moraxellaceae bacterium]|jgi:predicted metal-dependent hydrolase|nr:metal-dependent hydrolase [Moraxellaceae bacterium]
MSKHRKVAAAGMTVRRMDFDFDNLPRYWADNDPFLTHMLNALSATFPEGERMFIESVRAFRDRITDPEMQKAVSDFIGQEAMHSREHLAYNRYARQHGIDLGFIENFVTQRVAFIQKQLPPIRQLAITCALEHFTAILAEQILTTPEFYEKLDPIARDLWLWHAVEENEHKAVAFDVYEQMGGSYVMRARVMALTTYFFIAHQMWFHARLLKADGKLWDLTMWAKGLNTLWGRKGWFRKLVPAYLDYYRRGFHPWQHDTRALLEKWKRELALEKYAVKKAA